MKNFLILMICTALTAACSTALTPIMSLKEEGEDPKYRMSEPSSKLRFHLTNDHEFVYLFLNTNDPTSCRKILETGLKIYFDPRGGTGTNCFVEYPRLKKELIDQENANIDVDLRKLRKKVSDDASYKKILGSPERFDAMLSRLEMEIELSILDSTEISYRLKMPMSWIHPEGSSGLDKLSFGVKSGSFSMPAKFEISASSTQAQTNTNSNTNISTRGTLPVSQNNSRRTQRPDPLGLTSPIEFWYAIELSH